MGIGEILHVIVLSAFIIATLLALLSVMLDDAMKALRGFNGIFAYLFLLVGGGAAVRGCLKGISNVTGFSVEDIRGFIGFLFETLPVMIIILVAIGLGIWFAISSIIDKKKKKKERSRVILTPEYIEANGIQVNWKNPIEHKEEINDKNSIIL